MAKFKFQNSNFLDSIGIKFESDQNQPSIPTEKSTCPVSTASIKGPDMVDGSTMPPSSCIALATAGYIFFQF